MSYELIELPEGWVLTKLGEIIQPSDEKVEPSAIETLPYIGLEHIEKDTGKLLEYGSSNEVKSTKSKFYSGDLLYGKLRPYLNKVHLVNFEGVCSTDILVFSKNRYISNDFLTFRFLCRDFVRYASQNVNGVQHPRVNFQTLAEFPIAFPPLNEQKRIVAKIEALRERSRRAREALFEIPALCDRFRQSVLAAAFRGDLTADWRKQNQNTQWEEITLGEILKSKPRNGYSPKPVDYLTKVKSLTLTATTSGKFKPEHFKYIDEEIDQDSHLWLTPGDILIQRSNTLEYVGTCAIYDSNFGEFIYPDLMMKIQVIENKTKPEFIYYALSTETTRRYFKENATGTAGNMPKINQQVVMNTPIVLPSIEEQQEIIFRIQKLLKAADQIEQQYQEAKAYLDQLDQSILAKAFRGELVPQDPNDEPASVLLERIKAEREQLGEKKKTTRKSPATRSRKAKTETPTFEQMTIPGLEIPELRNEQTQK